MSKPASFSAYVSKLKNAVGFKAKPHSAITVVSGLPRSGTSMMMKMLEAGGLAPLTDHLRTADEDNPKGYYEFEPVKKLTQGDTAWLADAAGKAVKIISMLLKHLPSEYEYRLIFMERHLPETLASQSTMITHRQEQQATLSNEDLLHSYQKHLSQTKLWLQTQPNITVLFISYNALLDDATSQIERITSFLDMPLHQDSMAQVIDPTLYRQREG